MLRHALARRLDTGGAADIGDPRALLDECDFLVRLDHALAHRALGDIDHARARQSVLQLLLDLQRHVIELDAQGDAVGQQTLCGAEKIVPLPVGVDQVVTPGPAPGLAAVDVGGDRCRVALRHHQPIEAAEGAVEEIREVIDVVVGGEEGRIHSLRRHHGAQRGQAALHLGVGEGTLRLPAISNDLQRFQHDPVSPHSETAKQHQSRQGIPGKE